MQIKKMKEKIELENYQVLFKFGCTMKMCFLNLLYFILKYKKAIKWKTKKKTF